MDKSEIQKKSAFTFAELMISLIVISALSAILYPTIAQFTPNSNKPLFKAAYRMLSNILNEIADEEPNGELGTYDAAGVFIAYTPDKLCNSFCQKANVVFSNAALAEDPADRCSTECDDTTNNKRANTITTVNGMRWFFNEYALHPNPAPLCGADLGNESCAITENTFQIIVDVNSSNNDLSQIGVLGSRTIVTDITTIDKLFVTDCNSTRNGKCGVFYFDNKTGDGGIYETYPNYSVAPPTNAVYSKDKLKIQDTFEILVNNKGKIVGMSPAAWANLEDNSDN